MSHVLRVQLATPDDSLIHDFRNFGEDVFRALRHECEVSIDEIDASISEFHLRGILNRQVRTITAKVNKIAERYQDCLVIETHEVSEHPPA